MRNWEVKARCPAPEAIPGRVAALGGRFVATLRQRDTYFQVSRGRLKLREITPEGGTPAVELIQYDRPDRAEARNSDYVIAPVADAGATREALDRALGIRAVVLKTRRLYLWRRTRIHLDVVDGLGTFVELETVVATLPCRVPSAGCRAPDNATPGTRFQDELAEAAAALGIRDEDRVAVSYVDLVLVTPPGEEWHPL